MRCENFVFGYVIVCLRFNNACWVCREKGGGGGGGLSKLGCRNKRSLHFPVQEFLVLKKKKKRQVLQALIMP